MERRIKLRQEIIYQCAEKLDLTVPEYPTVASSADCFMQRSTALYCGTPLYTDSDAPLIFENDSIERVYSIFHVRQSPAINMYLGAKFPKKVVTKSTNLAFHIVPISRPHPCFQRRSSITLKPPRVKTTVIVAVDKGKGCQWRTIAGNRAHIRTTRSR